MLRASLFDQNKYVLLSTVYSKYEKDNENLNSTKRMKVMLQQM